MEITLHVTPNEYVSEKALMAFAEKAQAAGKKPAEALADLITASAAAIAKPRTKKKGVAKHVA